MSSPRVAVIVPSYNTAHYIAETLNSVFHQTYTNYEVVVVNDCSPDTPELERVLAPFQDRIRYIRHERNRGLSGARNTAIRAATAEYIALLDSDDIWPPDSLQKQVDYLQQHPGTDAVYGDAVFMGGSASGHRYSEYFPSTGPVTFESLITRRCNVFISVLARREAVLRAGLFDETLRRCEDFDLWCRLVKSGASFGYHNNVVMHYRRHDQSLSADETAMLRTIIEVHRNFLKSLRLLPPERTAVEKQLERYQAELLFCEGRAAFKEGDYQRAARNLEAANQVLRRPRLSMIVRLLQLCPRLLHWAYRRSLEVRARLRGPSKAV